MDYDSTNENKNGGQQAGDMTNPVDRAADELSMSAVQQIRDIIFGKEIQAFQTRFEKLEELIERTAGELRSELDTSVKTLETYVKTEFESLVRRLSEEEANRAKADQSASSKLETLSQEIEEQLRMLKTEAAEDRRSIREALLEQVRELQSNANDLERRTSALVEKVKTDLDGNKLDSTRLAQMLNEVASRVTGDS